MACGLDDLPIGSIVHFVGNSAAYCYNCNQYNQNAGQKGIYMGHIEMPSGRYALIHYTPVSICPICGRENREGLIPCEDGLDGLFTSKKVEITEDSQI